MLEPRSDGYASGLVTFVLQEAGLAPDNLALQRGLSWLRGNQHQQGYWSSSSQNKRRDPNTNVGRFMSDAATAYAVLSLSEAPDGAMPLRR